MKNEREGLAKRLVNLFLQIYECVVFYKYRFSEKYTKCLF